MYCLVLGVNGNLVQVSTAVDHVQRGTTVLQNAKKLQKNSRKWMCIAIILLLLIVAVVVVGVIQPWKSNKGAWVYPFCPYPCNLVQLVSKTFHDFTLPVSSASLPLWCAFCLFIYLLIFWSWFDGGGLLCGWRIWYS